MVLCPQTKKAIESDDIVRQYNRRFICGYQHKRNIIALALYVQKLNVVQWLANQLSTLGLCQTNSWGFSVRGSGITRNSNKDLKALWEKSTFLYYRAFVQDHWRILLSSAFFHDHWKSLFSVDKRIIVPSNNITADRAAIFGIVWSPLSRDSFLLCAAEAVFPIP